MTVRILRGDVRDRLRDLPDESVHCVVTSPPYWGLRDYGHEGQIGLEDDPRDFIDALVGVFQEVRRVLRADGTCWVNLGDSYNSIGHKKAGSGYGTTGLAGGIAQTHHPLRRENTFPGLKHKDLVGIPWRVAFALQADGWYLRQDIIWHKPNPMPESVRDRCTKAHEYIFLLSKSERYYYDQAAIAEAAIYSGITGMDGSGFKDPQSFGGKHGALKDAGVALFGNRKPVDGEDSGTRNKRSVWTVPTNAFPEAHFATFPPDLIEPCILAGCPPTCCATCGTPWIPETERESIALRPNSDSNRGHSPSHSRGTGQPQRGSVGVKFGATTWEPGCSCDGGTVPGTVLDPFGGAGTTGLVADRLQRDAILIELNPEYADMAERRIHNDAPLFSSVSGT